MYCKECGEYMNPVQAVLSSNNGVCGKCTRKNHRLAILGKGNEGMLNAE